MNKGVRDTHLCGNSSNAEAAWICFRSPVFYTKNGKLKFLPAYLGAFPRGHSRRPRLKLAKLG
ncbi:Uncharacterised protein [Ralstonia mannitolilytica]|uniref:Uncharacterized protein n=1 Tax=Ralstonia mannitolilytica TaxID=105219 RepID=A0AAJ4ZIR6_9RALS|nr:hypothetical protein LMG6866_04173 [Ralstonia mannitolilytica]CAJ0726642.1 hypothetical protein R77592_01056 [Ralstonia mannitolilytica]SUD86611.1 Uncharacterised protein [Ralstonia mannitolilytica]SUD96272.1 Uncharacterised protein [Ralstonia mannitolilytica]